MGRVTYLRVYSGSIESNTHAWNATRSEDERLGQLFFARGKEHINTDVIGTGDIGAVAKLDSSDDRRHPLRSGHADHACRCRLPGSSYATSVHPKTKADLDKMGQALQRLVEEDPTLRLCRDPSTGETILSGLGEPHVQIALDRMSRRFGVNVERRPPARALS